MGFENKWLKKQNYTYCDRNKSCDWMLVVLLNTPLRQSFCASNKNALSETACRQSIIELGTFAFNISYA